MNLLLNGRIRKMPKIKTGIMTLSAAENYGAVLQSHSLCKYLTEYYSYSEIIDFTPKFIVGRYPLFYLNKSTFWTFIKSLIWSFVYYPIRKKKRNRFNLFRYKDSTYSKNKYIEHYTDDTYDQYIVGSDQVFNLELTEYDKEFFLLNVTHKKATYAASVGVSFLSHKEKMILYRGLSGFCNISIREKVGCELIKGILAEKDVQYMIDPVFLNNEQYWSKLASKRLYKNNYIIIYTFVNFDLAYKIAKKINKNGVDILLICDSYKRQKSDVKNIKSVGPKEFLSLIKYSDYVITDSFHGTAFAIIFNKQFYSIPYKGTESRFIDLLDLFGLEDRLVKRFEEINESHVDYSLFKQRLDFELKRTKSYFDNVYKS